MKRLSIVVVCSILAVVLCAVGPATAADKFPTKPITVICPWSPGGGTDRTARFISDLLSKRSRCSGQCSQQDWWRWSSRFFGRCNARPDGYTITNLTFEIGGLKWMGYAPITPVEFKPLVQFNEDASAVIVGKNSSYNSVKDLLEDIKAKPAGTFQFSGCGIGTVWDLARIGMMNDYGMNPNQVKFIPTKGAAPAVTELMGGHVDVITCSYPEASPQIEAGNLKALAIMAPERNPQFNDVPTLKEQGIDWSYGTWRGFAVPKDTPDEIANVLIKAYENIFASQEFLDFMNKNGFGIKMRIGEEFGDFMIQQHKDLEAIISLAGYGKK